MLARHRLPLQNSCHDDFFIHVFNISKSPAAIVFISFLNIGKAPTTSLLLPHAAPLLGPVERLLHRLKMGRQIVVVNVLAAELLILHVHAHARPTLLSLLLLCRKHGLMIAKRLHVLGIGVARASNGLSSVLCLLRSHRHLLRMKRLHPLLLLAQKLLYRRWQLLRHIRRDFVIPTPLLREALQLCLGLPHGIGLL